MLEQLFSPIDIGPLTVENRVVMPPMMTRFAGDDGYVSDQTRAYYRERAKGGTGLIIFEGTYPCEKHPKRHFLVDDSYVDGLRTVVDAVHEEGTNVAIQLNAHRGVADQVDPRAPSPLTMPDGREIPAIEVDDLEAMVASFAAGAGRAKRAGFDGIEIHACSGYLVHEFLSPYTNDRDDEYGGSLEGRTKLARDLLAAVREEVGEDLPVWFRIPGDEFVEGGIRAPEASRIAARLVDAGTDAVHVTGGHFLNARHVVLSGRDERGVYADLAAAVREAVDVPVITVGRVNDPVTAEEILAAGKADLVAMGRAHLADPHFVRKAKNGQLDRIRHCVGGLEGCRDLANGTISCTVNAELGHEAGWTADDEGSGEGPLAVLVVGGGPAGMEAARVSAERGHDVTLVEKQPELGGQLRWAQNAPAKGEYETLVSYYESELDSLGVDVRLGHEMERSAVGSFGADEVVVAVGAVPDVPNIDGIGAAIAAGTVVTAEAALSDPPAGTGARVVVGGNETAFDVADYLSDHGVATTIVAEDELLPLRGASPGEISTRPHIIERVESSPHVEILREWRVSAIADGRVTVRGDGDERAIECAQVVLADSTPEVTFERAIDDDVDARVIGDADGVRGLHNAIHEGTAVGRSLPRVP